ncbi:Bug family tripartite tricarboxylate transporter substrate binding protein [Paracraurococcus ruber]|uniref:Tripartite tricarboxylate transporter substrate binding protein n=1 Tax=Paracraurococcus ruber TaxID=77675 RepID=A0ABS1D5V5_9PROT|nr:tripartite tricarboxylate transporter substrate-binding protein [Paracraurococcus ruber]MBK1661936.1 hypothetical protein [Paracraurococcus ruber]TDG16559.1 hypothetical protein E2C05_29100 [Paracraurococcus ruber]
MMDITRRSTLTLALSTAGSSLHLAMAQDAATYPSRPVRLLVGFAPGGPLDFVARAVAERLTPRFGQSFLVENRLGATGNVAAEAVARATPPDGHLLLMGNPQNLSKRQPIPALR